MGRLRPRRRAPLAALAASRVEGACGPTCITDGAITSTGAQTLAKQSSKEQKLRQKLYFQVALAVLAIVAPGTSTAKTVLTPGPKPTAIEPGRAPFTFSRPPTIKSSFERSEPFLEGEIAYGYSGKVFTPIIRGSDIVAPAGSPAYGVPMQGSERNTMSGKTEIFPLELVWCAVTRKAASPKAVAVCLFNEGLGFGGNDSLMTSGVNFLDRDPYGGGEIAPAPFDLGAPVRIQYFVQNLGKIARIKARILVGDSVANEWGYIFGDIGRGKQPDERLFAVGGGVIEISRDPTAKNSYVLKIVQPLKPDGGVPLTEVRNDTRMTPP